MDLGFWKRETPTGRPIWIGTDARNYTRLFDTHLLKHLGDNQEFSRELHPEVRWRSMYFHDPEARMIDSVVVDTSLFTLKSS
ncbi:MAG: hypothetical protein ACRDF4_02080 [Rhabdochlamydiaceae bacterium]